MGRIGLSSSNPGGDAVGKKFLTTTFQYLLGSILGLVHLTNPSVEQIYNCKYTTRDYIVYKITISFKYLELEVLALGLELDLLPQGNNQHGQCHLGTGE